MDDDTNYKEDASKDDRELSSQSICRVSVEQYSDPSTELEDRSQESSESGVADSLGTGSFTERVHRQDLSKHSLVVSVDETTHTGEDGDHCRSTILEKAGRTWFGSKAGTSMLNVIVDIVDLRVHCTSQFELIRQRLEMGGETAGPAVVLYLDSMLGVFDLRHFHAGDTRQR